MNLGLKNKIAIITGASKEKSIGATTAKTFAEEGVNIVNASRSEMNDKDVREIEAKGVEVVTVNTDVTKPDSVNRMVDQVVKKFGKIDILVCSAGAGSVSSLQSLSYKEWQATMDLNLFGVVHCCKAVFHHMVKQKWGRIVNISSVFGRYGPPLMYDYNASKAAVIAFTKTLSDEGAPHNVLANSVCPGPVSTTLWTKSSPHNSHQ